MFKKFLAGKVGRDIEEAKCGWLVVTGILFYDLFRVFFLCKPLHACFSQFFPCSFKAHPPSYDINHSFPLLPFLVPSQYWNISLSFSVCAFITSMILTPFLALPLCSAKQRKLLEDNYGKESPTCVKRVKQLYVELGIAKLYLEKEEDSYRKINKMIKVGRG